MAKLTKYKSTQEQQIDKAVAALESARVQAHTAGVFKSRKLSNFISVESADVTPQEYEEVNNELQTVNEVVEDTFGEDFVNENMGATPAEIDENGNPKIPEHSLEAARILLAASSNLPGFQQAKSKFAASLEGVQENSMNQQSLFSGSAGTLSVLGGDYVAVESFDEKELNKFLNYSIIFNVLASRQDEFNQGFFQALTVTPDEVGYRVEVRLEKVWNGVEHLPNGDVAIPVKRNLIDALVHPEVLESNATDIIPFYQKAADALQDGADKSRLANKHHFLIVDGKVDAAAVALEDISVLTAPLKVGMDHNLLGLSSHPALIANGLMNEKDSLDSRIAVKEVVLKAEDEYFSFDTSLLYTSAFYKSVEGQMRKMTLSFDNNSFLVSKEIKVYDGSKVVPAFDSIGDYDIRLHLRLNGTASVEYGTVNIEASPVRVAQVMKNGKEINFRDVEAVKANAGLEDLIKKLEKITVEGFVLEARRTNYNLRTRGRLIDSEAYHEQITIPLRAPISLQKPITGGDKEHPDVSALVNAARTMANNDGVATILNLAGLLERITSRKNYTWEADRNSFPGIARHFIQPCYLYEHFHLPTMINSVSSENRLKDIQGAIVTKLNEIIGRVLKVSNYIPVVDQMTGGNPGKIVAVIGTDYRLPQYITTQGDTRLFGGKVDYEIVRTSNKLMSNKVVMTLTRKNSGNGPDPFSFGTFVWSPELMVSQQLTQGASTYVRHMVQPRYLHVVNVPILVEIDVTGIEEVTGETTVLLQSPVTKEDAGKVGNAAVVPAPSQVVPTGKKKQD